MLSWIRARHTYVQDTRCLEPLFLSDECASYCLTPIADYIHPTHSRVLCHEPRLVWVTSNSLQPVLRHGTCYLTKQYNLVLDKQQWCSKVGKVNCRPGRKSQQPTAAFMTTVCHRWADCLKTTIRSAPALCSYRLWDYRLTIHHTSCTDSVNYS